MCGAFFTQAEVVFATKILVERKRSSIMLNRFQSPLPSPPPAPERSGRRRGKVAARVSGVRALGAAVVDWWRGGGLSSMTRQLDSSARCLSDDIISPGCYSARYSRLGAHYARLIPWAAGRRRARWHAQLSRRRRRRRWQPPRQQDRMCRPWCMYGRVFPVVFSQSRATLLSRNAALAGAAANNSDNALLARGPTDTAPRGAAVLRDDHDGDHHALGSKPRPRKIDEAYVGVLYHNAFRVDSLRP